MSTLERLRTTLAALSLTAIDARLEALLESASKKEPAYADFLLEAMSRRVSIALGHSQMEFTEFYSLGVC